jgi:hypothetical protein
MLRVYCQTIKLNLMKTILKNTKRISAILIATIIISCNLSAQSSTSFVKAKFTSFIQERRSTRAYKQLIKLTNVIEEKIKFRVPSVNENENAIPVLLKYEYTGETNHKVSSNHKTSTYKSNYKVLHNNEVFEALNEITSSIAEKVKFRSPSANESILTDYVNEITSQIEQKVKFTAPSTNEIVSEDYLNEITNDIANQIKFHAPESITQEL